MDTSKIDFKKLRSKIHLLYGLDLDETTLAILSVLLLEMRRELGKTAHAQQQLLRNSQRQQTILQADPKGPYGQAFFYGFGQWGLGLCLLVILAAALSVWGIRQDRKETEILIGELSWYKQYYERTGQASTAKAAAYSKKHPQPK